MKRFEYDISKHTLNNVDELVYFCSDSSECGLQDVGGEQTEALGEVLNERGGEGWELVQLAFGKDGIIAFWKREL